MVNLDSIIIGVVSAIITAIVGHMSLHFLSLRRIEREIKFKEKFSSFNKIRVSLEKGTRSQFYYIKELLSTKNLSKIKEIAKKYERFYDTIDRQYPWEEQVFFTSKSVLEKLWNLVETQKEINENFKSILKEKNPNLDQIKKNLRILADKLIENTRSVTHSLKEELRI